MGASLGLLDKQFPAVPGAVADGKKLISGRRVRACRARQNRCLGQAGIGGRACGRISRLQAPCFANLFEVETLQYGRVLMQADGRGVAPQAACQLSRGRVRVADHGQQDLDQLRGVQIVGEVDAGLALPLDNFRIGGQVEVDAIDTLAPTALFLHGRQQAGLGEYV